MAGAVRLPEDLWVSDTTLRDGQQSMRAFTTRQSVQIFKFLNEIDNNTGAIRQAEFFVYSEPDRQALLECMELGCQFPEATTWIRASRDDFRLIKSLGIKETGMLMSCSDYHIFKKFNSTRTKTMESFLSIAELCLREGIRPRCHLEDITRADMDGFVVPLVKNLVDLCEGTGMELKVRACDTLGLGLPNEESPEPRNVPRIIQKLQCECGLESRQLEWHGHNDFHLGVANSMAAWINGASSISSTLLGRGERCGNTTLEGMLALYCQIKGEKRLRLDLLNDVVEFFAKSLDYFVPEKYPILGTDFNTTKAGIHADGLLKDPEIYNSFDTKKILNRPIVIMINQSSGSSGIAGWLNNYYKLKGTKMISKKDQRVALIKNWVDAQYERGRTDNITNEELRELASEHFPEIAPQKHGQSQMAHTEI
jgi:isopropylmalate/homocitrate/citramalate synthase